LRRCSTARKWGLSFRCPFREFPRPARIHLGAARFGRRKPDPHRDRRANHNLAGAPCGGAE
jgi:hypothetical protein